MIAGGRIVGVYVKMRPNEDGVAAGYDPPVFACRDVSFGIGICNDANDPALAAALAARGATLIVHLLNNMLRPETADRWRGRSITNLRDRARETGCWTVSADVAGRHDGRIGHGCTLIVDPGGVIRASAPEGIEGAAVFDIT